MIFLKNSKRRIAEPKLNKYEYQRFIDSLHKKCYVETESNGGSVIKIIKTKDGLIDKIVIKSDINNKRTVIYPEDVTFWEPYSYIIGMCEYGWEDVAEEDLE